MKKQVLLFVLMLMPLMASAQIEEIDGIWYNLYSSNKVAEVTFDPSVDPFENTEVETYTGVVVIPEFVVYGGTSYSVTRIGEFAFKGCSGLTTVVIPNSIKSIGFRAFNDCIGLSSLNIPNSILDIEEGHTAFDGCTSLEKVTLHPNIVKNWFAGIKTIKEIVVGDEVTSIEEYAFSGCTGLKFLTIGNSLESIGMYAFSDCYINSVFVSDIAAWCKIRFNSDYLYADHLLDCPNPLYHASHLFLNGEEVEDLVIPDGVSSINNFAFTGFKRLTSITIPNSVTSIGWMAFYQCKGLNSITFGNGMVSIGGKAFGGCSGLTSIHLNDIAAWCKIKFAYLDDGVDYYDDWSSNPLYYAHHLFYNGEEVKDLVIPYGVTSIEDHAFRNCSNLSSVNISNSVTSIGYRAFFGCLRLNSINVAEDNTIYDSRNNCNAIILTSENKLIMGCNNSVIPNSVVSIGDNAFSDCPDLTSVTIPNGVTSIGDNAFRGCSGLTSVNISDIAAWCNISFGSNPLNYAHHLFLNGEEVKNLIIPSSVTSIKEGTFSGCSGLTSVTIPNSVTSIGGSAFSGCTDIEKITFHCHEIGLWFRGLNSIKEVLIGDEVKSIGNYAFSDCSGLTSVTIPNSVTSIGNYAFQGCSGLSSVSIGKGIKSVGAKAFANCPEIKEMYCYAKDVPTISNDTFENSYYIKFATLYVPESSVDLYKASVWSQFGNILGITGGNEGERCAKPVITLLANGKIKVESSTEGATCVTNVTASNAEPLADGEISLNTPLTVYTVTSYATKEGYDDSEVATATFRYEKAEGDMNGDGMLNITDVIHLVNMILGQ